MCTLKFKTTERFKLDSNVYLLFSSLEWIFSKTKMLGLNQAGKQQSWREHQRFSHVPRVSSTSTDQKCWVGMCLQSPIQWNWFHPATPHSWELLISQVWNRSERSSRRRTSGSREKDWKVELKLADIWCILLLQSISCHRCKYIFVLLIFYNFSCYAVQIPFTFIHPTYLSLQSNYSFKSSASWCFGLIFKQTH